MRPLLAGRKLLSKNKIIGPFLRMIQIEWSWSVIDYLLERLQRGQIYTWIDTVLLAINPKGENTSIGDIYDLSQADKYYNIHIANCRKIQPHIFTVAIRAYYRLIQDLGKLNQVNPCSFLLQDIHS